MRATPRPAALDLDEGRRFPICQPEPLAELFRDAGLKDVAVRPIHVSVPLMVEPGPRVVLDAIAAIDAAIADPRVIVWANRGLTRQNLTGATITMIDGRWRWRIMQAGGQADVFIDPVSGRVVETDL